jgi:hypothetical protein
MHQQDCEATATGFASGYDAFADQLEREDPELLDLTRRPTALPQ